MDMLHEATKMTEQEIIYFLSVSGAMRVKSSPCTGHCYLKKYLALSMKEQ